MAVGKRARGWLLRLILKRTVAVVLGLTLIVPAAFLLFQDFSWESPITDGLGLTLGATGIALVLAGLGGRRPDWVDPQ